MLRVWNLMDRWAEESGAALLYGLVKGDNQEGATLLTSAFDEKDSFLPHYQRGSLNKIEYLLGCKEFPPIRVATHHMAALYCRQEITTERRDYLCDRRRYS
jgi:hypothetical protein